ncbi:MULTISPECIES: hypothetical protein [Polymorphospora]|uniref:Uncharacterized protein n=1 Tax=Polymorphospora lycopeni TaxID=3140240 RepID=A0ABV5CHR6_9ACTN
MKTWVRKSLSVGVLAAGGLLLTQTAASADVITGNNFGIGNGTQAVAPVQAVVDVCGNGVAGAAGVSFAACDGGASATNEGVGDVVSFDNYGIGNGTQAVAPVQAVADVCGNGVSGAGGVAFAACDGGADASMGEENGNGGGYYSAREATTERTEGRWDKAATNIVSSGNYGILNGTQVYAPIQTVINVCGLAIPALGGVAFAECDGGASAEQESTRLEGRRGGGTNLVSTGNYGIGNGTQVYAPVQTVIDVCGNSVAGLGGVSFAACDGGASAENESRGGTTMLTGDNYGIGNGTQAYTPIQLVGELSGNAVSAAGGVAFAGSEGGASAELESTSKEEALPILDSLPVVAGLPVVGSLGKGVPAVADTNLGTKKPARTTAAAEEGYGSNGGGVDLITMGNYGIGNGTQVFAPVQIVADVSGNAVAGAGGVAFAASEGGASAEQ